MANTNSTSQLNHDERLSETPSSSRCLMVNENTTATMDFEVSYPQLKGMAVGEYVSSRFFKVGGYHWTVNFYPDPTDRFYASAYVRCMGRGDNSVRAKFTLSILEKEDHVELSPLDTTEHMFSLARSVLHCKNRRNAAVSMLETENLISSLYARGPVFSPGRYEWGFPMFVEKLKLEQLSLFGDGCFTIRCVLTVINEESLPLELPGHLERALRDGIGMDVTFDVGGMPFSAHSIILAERSPVFDAQLFGPMKEKDMRRIEVVDMEPAIFEMLLHFIYTDSLPTCDGGAGGHDTAVMQHLLVAADRYGMDRLKLMCEQKLCNMVNRKTVETTLALADQHGCKRLKDECLDIMWRAGVPGGVRATNRLFMESHAYGDGGSRGHDGVVPPPETSSSKCLIATENITATLNFELGNYLLLKDVGIGTCVSSDIVRVGGYDWTIRFYPEGQGTSGDHASAFLHCSGRRGGQQVRAKFTLRMLQNEGQVQLATFDEAERDFATGEYDWGYPEFVEKSVLNWLSIFGDVCFTITCVLTVMIEEPLPLELPDHLERALNGGRGADVTFDVGGGREFSAHRFVLAARSPVFAAELFGPTMETDARRVEVADMEPAIFRMILHFLYTDSFPPCNDEEGHRDVVMQHLIVAADRYGLGKLKMMCEKKLYEAGDLKSVTTTLALEDQRRYKRLKFMSMSGVLGLVLVLEESLYDMVSIEMK